MKRILIVDMQSFLWSYISIRSHLYKYETIIFLYSIEQFKTIKSLSKLIKKLIIKNTIKHVQFIIIESSSSSQSVYERMFNITNDISDSYNPNYDIFHLMCWQYPQTPILKTLEDNGFYFTSIKANPVFLSFDDEKEARIFLLNAHLNNSNFIAVKESDTSYYDPNILLKREIPSERDDLIDIELFSLSVIDFLRADLRYFSAISDEDTHPDVKIELEDMLKK